MSDTSVAILANHRTEHSGKSGRKRCQTWPEYDPHGLAAFLSARHPEKTAEHVMAATGLPERTVRRWIGADPGTPSFVYFFRLVAVYGPPVAAAALRRCPSWIVDAERMAEAAEIKRQIRHHEQRYRDLLDGDR